MNSIVPIPKCAITIRLATMDDLPFLDSLQKLHSKQLGYFPTKQFEGYIEMGGVLVAESGAEAVASSELRVASENELATSNPQRATPRRVGYIISRDRYLKRDELGVIYQLCVAPGSQRGLIGASLVREVFARSAYGCRLYCCWCAKDLEANYFWESMGFVPIAFRAGSAKKSRVHIFWQKRIVENDVETKWWYPSKTDQGAIREDRLVFPIPPGVSWRDVEAVVVPGAETPKLEDRSSKQARSPKLKASKAKPRRADTPMGGFRFAGDPPAAATGDAGAIVVKTKAPRGPKAKVDPKLVAAARELRDRWLEKVNAEPTRVASIGKYEVTRTLPVTPQQRGFGATDLPLLAA